MDNLRIILNELKSRRQGFKGEFFIPEVWNSFGFSEYRKDSTREGEIDVNPYDFMVSCIEECIIPQSGLADNLLMQEEDTRRRLDPGASIIYSMLPRMFTAWNHYSDGRFCTGTFLKTICLLPYLKKFNVDIIYLLPIFEYSNMYKKGEIGSPYAIKNIYKIDKNLHDSLIGDNAESMINVEFKAFVEACHMFGIKVMLDFVFRAAARDCDIMVEHPDWFYWIKNGCKDTFGVPYIGSLGELTEVRDDILHNLYTCDGVNEYLDQFTQSPEKIDPEKWQTIVSRHKQTGENMMSLIEEQFGITTAPAFPPVINDTQPPWTDVTYLRFYSDVHEKARNFVSDTQAPFILPDTAKLSLYSGQLRNTELWDYTAGVIPYYQKNFGIDGARIDMGHALPAPLNKEIVTKAKENNPDFLFWSEEFDTTKSNAAKEDGFDYMTGCLWLIYKHIETSGFYEMITNALLHSILRVTSALETPDTPRAALRYKDIKSLELMLLMSCFTPNTVLMINNGMEVGEIQPMNLGLDNTEQGRFVLDRDDPMYGKLAFFDNYCLHWTNEEGRRIREILRKALAIRKRFTDVCKRENFIYQHQFQGDSKLIGFSYFENSSGRCVFFLANRDGCSEVELNFEVTLPEQIERQKKVNILYKDDDFLEIEWSFQEVLSLSPKGVVVGFIE